MTCLARSRVHRRPVLNQDLSTSEPWNIERAFSFLGWGQPPYIAEAVAFFRNQPAPPRVCIVRESSSQTNLRKEYFIPLGSSSYGNLILKRRKAEFEVKVARLTSLVQSYAKKVQAGIAEKIR